MLYQDFTPKDPSGTLQVIVIGRLSKPKENEDRTQQTMEASCGVAIEYAKRRTQQPMNIIKLAEQSSGLLTKRSTMIAARELIASGGIDLVVCEDLSRVYRNPRHQLAFVQDALDQKTHVISVNDGLDTTSPGWETILGAAALRHGTVVSDTQHRVKRSADDAFERGGCVLKIRFGYRKLSHDEAKSGAFGPVGLRVAKLEEHTTTIKKMIAILKETRSFARVAEWCSENQVPYGPYQTEPWLGLHAKSLLTNPMLGGYKHFRDVKCRRLYGDGTVLREHNPNPSVKHYPELAHLTDAEFEELQTLLNEIKEQNVALRNRNANRDKPIVRKDVLFPGQHACCGICAKKLWQFGPHVMKCSARRKHQLGCFNRVQFDQTRLRHTLIDWLVAKFADHPGVTEKLLETAVETHAQLQHKLDDKHQQLLESRESAEKRLKKLGKLIMDCDDEAADVERCFQQEFKLLTKRLAKLDKELQTREQLPQEFPSKLDPEELAKTLPSLLKKLSDQSREFSSVLRKLFPKIHIKPIQALDSTQIWPRAYVTFNPRVLLPFADDLQLAEEFTLDLFTPSVQFKYREQAVALKAETPQLSYVKIADLLGTSNQTICRAMKLHAKMLELGLQEPYRLVEEAPVGAARWRDWPDHWKRLTNKKGLPPAA